MSVGVIEYPKIGESFGFADVDLGARDEKGVQRHTDRRRRKAAHEATWGGKLPTWATREAAANRQSQTLNRHLNLGRGLQNRARTSEQDAASTLLDRAEGKGLVSRAMAAQQAQATQAGLQSQLVSTPGTMNPAMVRAARQAQAEAPQAIAAQTALAAQRERDAALRGYMGTTGNIRAGDQGLFGTEAGYGQAMERLSAGYANMGLQDTLARRRAHAELSNLRTQLQIANWNADRKITQEKKARVGKAIAGGIQAAGSILAMASDRKAKREIKPGTSDVRDWLNSLDRPKSYHYRDPDRHGHGRRTGPMAQDIQRSRAGRKLVEPDDDGTLTVDYGQAMPLVLSALGDLHRRIEDRATRRAARGKGA